MIRKASIEETQGRFSAYTEPTALRAGIHYAFAFAILSIYGGEVCPFLEELGIVELGLHLFVSFLLAFLIRPFLLRSLVSKRAPLDQPRRRFFVEFCLFVTVGVGLTVHNMLVDHFPMGSGLKLSIGCAALGLFATIDLVLAAERTTIHSCPEERDEHCPPRFTSLTRKFSIFSVTSIILVNGVLLLVMLRDVQWISDMGEEGMDKAKLMVTIEILVLAFVFLAQSINLVLSYASNLRHFLSHETRAMNEVCQGNLSVSVPITTADEFGMMAERTNRMIEGLRERDRATKVLGKVVSPQVFERLMNQSDSGLRLGGSRLDVAILVSDIRNFTTRTEGLSPETVVADLNIYFERMVSIVHDHGGFVDKFMGDGLLAVFGLVDPKTACERAVQTALVMQQHVGYLDEELSSPIQIGVGINCGETIVGNIGSADRLEYTVIGDVVNIAARLESQTKQLGASILISSLVRDRLPPGHLGFEWHDFGGQALKGKTGDIEVFGLIRNKTAPSAEPPT